MSGHETVVVLLPGFAINWYQNQVTKQLQFRDHTHIYQHLLNLPKFQCWMSLTYIIYSGEVMVKWIFQKFFPKWYKHFRDLAKYMALFWIALLKWDWKLLHHLIWYELMLVNISVHFCCNSYGLCAALCIMVQYSFWLCDFFSLRKTHIYIVLQYSHFIQT